MEKKRILAGLLALAMTITFLGVIPVQAQQEDGIAAQWIAREELAAADQEILLRPEQGTLAEEASQLAETELRYDPSDVVTVIVEMEEAPLLKQAMDAGMSAEVFVTSRQGAAQAQRLARNRGAVRAMLRTLSGNVACQSVNGASQQEYEYSTVFNGFSMKLRYGDLERARQVEGVKQIFIAEQYGLPATLSEDEYTVSMSSSSGMVGAVEANQLGYDGTGTIVAIGDTGIESAHDAFSVMPTDGKYTKEAIADLVKQPLACGVTDGDAVYVNEKIPFAYDYADGDSNAEAVGQAHGVHVAGTVAGNNGEDFFGVAPNAQLMIMKIFGDDSGSTSDDIILAGIDDAVKLGADSINLSLGSPAGFPYYGDEDTGDSLTQSGVYERAYEAGVNILIAAGNETISTYMNPYGNNLSQTKYPDSGIVGSPSTYPAGLSVASVDNSAWVSDYFMVGEEKHAFAFPVDYSTKAPIYQVYELYDRCMDGPLPYVVVDGFGAPENYADLDVTGKLALVQRGELSFDEKAANAQAAGAIGVLVYDNVSGSLGTPALQNYTIPLVLISRASGASMVEAAVKEVTFDYEYHGLVANPAGGQMSSFSSIGPAPDLSLKPEITAPGGNIYSSVLDNEYASMGGTSMATPHVAGLSAILRQYLQKTYDVSGKDLANLTTSLLMSTAVPAVDAETDAYFAPRRQGAGVANVYNAITSGNYLSVKGCDRPKAEVGSSVDGNYSFTLSVHNLDGISRTYAVDTVALVETVTSLDVGDKTLSFAANHPKRLSDKEVSVTYAGPTDGKVTVPAGGSATLEVSICLTEAGKTYIDQNFENGSYVEGFVFLTPMEGVTLSAPFLGFYGDWAGLEMLDEGLDGTPNMAATFLADLDQSGNGYYVGLNRATACYHPDQLAFAPQRGGRILTAQLSLLRNAAQIEQTVTDEHGNVIFRSGNLGSARKTYATATSTGYQMVTYTSLQGWNGRLPADGVYNVGDWAEAGKYYTYSLNLTPVGSDIAQSREYRVYLDDQDPVVQDPQLYEEEGMVYLTFVVQDDYYVQRVRIVDSAMDSYYLIAAEEFDEISTPGSKTRLTFDVTGLAKELSATGKNPGRVGILMEDIANNTSLTFVDIGPQSISLTGTQVQVGESAKIPVSIQPERLSAVPLTWSSENPGVATVDETGVVTGVSDGVAVITATASSHISGRCQVTVGKGVTVQLTYGEAPELNARFQTDDGLYWKVTGADTVQLIKENSEFLAGYPQISGELTIPATVEYSGQEFRVTSIGDYAFYMNRGITSVAIPEGVTEVGPAAFVMCYGLRTVQLPESLEKIGERAFYFCANANISIPDGVKVIEADAFHGTAIQELDLPYGLEVLGNDAFAFCSDLTEVIIPETVMSYGSNLFLGCKKLRYAELPSNLREIPADMFYQCEKLERIQIPDGVERIGVGAFYGCGLKSLVLPASVKEIGNWAFAWMSRLEHLVIPDGVTHIGSRAFAYGNGIRSISLGEGIERIGESAFFMYDIDEEDFYIRTDVKTEHGAIALRRSGYGGEIYLNGVLFEGYAGNQFVVDGVTYMPTSDTTVEALSCEESLVGEHLVIPAQVTCAGDDRTYTVTGIGERFMYRNHTIKTVELPDSVTYVEASAFTEAGMLESIRIPENLERVEDRGFSQMGYYEPYAGEWKTDTLIIPETMKTWGPSIFANGKFRRVVISEGVERIGYSAFGGMRDLTSVVLPESLKEIGAHAFGDCTEIADLTLPKNLEYIGDSAFQYISMETLVLPESVWHVGSRAFGTLGYGDTAGKWVGPATVQLNGKLRSLGWNSFRGDADITAVLNSQRNMVVAYGDLEKLPTVVWDGKTDIPFNDGSYVPAGKTVTVTGDVVIDGKLTIEGKLVVDPTATLTITEDAVIVGEENIEYKVCEGGEGCYSKAFTDLNTNAWYHAYTDYVIAHGLMNGVSDTRFAPNAQLTRGMLVTTLYRLAGEPEVTEAATFTDVAENQYYTDAIAWAEDVGIAQGMGEGKFAPNGAVTREQGMTFLYRYVVNVLGEEPAKNGDLSIFKDADKIGKFAQGAMAWGTAAGLLEGYGDGTVGPKNSVTRAQMAKFLTILSKAF